MKVQELFDKREKLRERSLNLESMMLNIRVKNSPAYKQVGWFKDRIEVMSRADTQLLYEFLMSEKFKVEDEIRDITSRLDKVRVGKL